MTEDQQGGTAPEQEAIASTEPASEKPVAAVAVADEPAESQATPSQATPSQAPGGPPTGDSDDADGAVTTSSPADDQSGAVAALDTADAPAAVDEEEEEPEPPAPPRPAGPEPTTMEELLAEQDSEIRSFKHGDVVEGKVVRIDKDEMLVDIGAKSEGVVSNRELYGRHAETQPQLTVGDTVLVYVLQPESQEGHVVLSLRRAGLERKWRAMQEQFEAGAIIEAPVIDHNKGGLIVDCGIRGFVPISQIVDFPRRPQNDQPRDAAQEIAEKLQPFVGRKLRLKILEVNRKANRLILSEKVALYEERREKRDELFSSLQVGQRVKGTVRSIAQFGVFIDLGGIDGLVHKSELSWNKVNNPEAGYRLGDEVEAEVIDINHERGRISLSIRRLQPDPWHSTVADFKVGDVIDGTVTKLVNFGAFVRVRDGLEGLIHISELSHQRVAHPGDVVHEGQQLKLKIISLDSERHRLGLSLKQAEEPPARPAPEPGHAPAPRGERRPRPDRAWTASDAVQEPEGGIDNTLAAAFAQVRDQLAASEEARARSEDEEEGPAGTAPQPGTSPEEAAVSEPEFQSVGRGGEEPRLTSDEPQTFGDYGADREVAAATAEDREETVDPGASSPSTADEQPAREPQTFGDFGADREVAAATAEGGEEVYGAAPGEVGAGESDESSPDELWTGGEPAASEEPAGEAGTSSGETASSSSGETASSSSGETASSSGEAESPSGEGDRPA